MNQDQKHALDVNRVYAMERVCWHAGEKSGSLGVDITDAAELVVRRGDGEVARVRIALPAPDPDDPRSTKEAAGLALMHAVHAAAKIVRDE